MHLAVTLFTGAMPRFDRVDISDDSTRMWVRFHLVHAIPERSTSVTMSVLAANPGGVKRMSVRFENRVVADRFFEADGQLHRLPTEGPGLLVTDLLVAAAFPSHLLADGPYRLDAQLMVNGILTQNHFPVALID